MWPVVNSSGLIGGKFIIQKKSFTRFALQCKCCNFNQWEDWIDKGQIKPKADWRAVDSPKKGVNEFILFAFLLFTTNKSNLFVRSFLGESMARQSCFWFYLTFSRSHDLEVGLYLNLMDDNHLGVHTVILRQARLCIKSLTVLTTICLFWQIAKVSNLSNSHFEI